MREYGKRIKEAYMRHFYSVKTYPKDGEVISYDGREYTAHLKQENEDCERCCFHRDSGCALDCHNLGCFDKMNGRRFYFTEGDDNGKKTV